MSLRKNINKLTLILVCFLLNVHLFGQVIDNQSNETNREKILNVSISPVDKGAVRIGSVSRSTLEMRREAVETSSSYIKFVNDLNPNKFEVSIKGKEQEILSFEKNESPMSIGILIDSSASMEDGISDMKSGLLEFLNASNPQNEYFLASFNEEIDEHLDLTTNLFEVREQITGISKPKAKKTLY